jgi:catechol 2,3-dioxygenase-like lactoylglutathione lyase family enzyme
MSADRACLTIVTLGVDDLARGIRFYETLGFVRRARGSGNGIAFFAAGGTALALYPWDLLAEDASVPAGPRPSAFRGTALAWNCPSPALVDQMLAKALSAGGNLLKPAQQVFWGGYSGYFADPDGHVWEVAHNPFFPQLDDGRLALPD